MADATTEPEHNARTFDAQPPEPPPDGRADRLTAEVIAGGAGAEALAGVAAIALGIIGLAAVWPAAMTAVALVVLGAGLVAHGAAIAARWRPAQRGLDPLHSDRNGVWIGLGAEVLGGVIAVVLAALVLGGRPPDVLLPAATIVLGCALLLAGMAVPEVGDLAPAPGRSFRHEAALQRLVEGSGGAMVLAGIAAASLGILALLVVGPVIVLELVAVVVIGVVVVLSGGALTTRFARRAV